MMNERKASRPTIFRRSLLLPAEHGSWSWLLVPLFLGAAVGGRLNGAVLLVLAGSLSAFLMRQPATGWFRIRRGKGRRSDLGLARGWTVAFAAIAILSLAGLLALGHAEILVLFAPLSLLLLIYLWIALRQRAQLRSLGMEMAGAAGLAMSAPAAYAAATGRLDSTAWFLWLLAGMLNALGVLYVRRRLADNRGRSGSRVVQLVFHAAALAVVSGLIGWGLVPWPAVLPFAALVIRAAWLARRPRPVANVKRFGFTEVAVESVSALAIALGYWL
ncbi:MAG: YwiC-like family protein [Anaerolineae bacterium]|nr:YwiC-like family protein [Anaerolineae bacterium]